MKVERVHPRVAGNAQWVDIDCGCMAKVVLAELRFESVIFCPNHSLNTPVARIRTALAKHNLRLEKDKETT